MRKSAIPLVRLDPATQPQPQWPATAACTYQQYEAPLRRESAHWLGIEPGMRMLRRVVTLAIDGQPVLNSTSYLPVELADDDPAWHDASPGKLALAGYPITLADSPRLYARLPTTMERVTLDIPPSADIPLMINAIPYYIHNIQPNPVRSGVIIRSRSDRVIRHGKPPDYDALELEQE